MNRGDIHDDLHGEYLEAMRGDPRSMQRLVSQALNAKDEEETWEAVGVLWYRPSRDLLNTAQRLLQSKVPRERLLGVRMLGQGTLIPDRADPDDSLALLLPLLDHEQDPEVLSAIGWALGQIEDPRGIGPLIRLKAHPKSDVRHGVALGLFGQPDDLAITTLIELSQDTDTKVRNWAVFALAQMYEVDTPNLRAALWARVADQSKETRDEATRGLALRADPTIVGVILQEFAQAKGEVTQIMFDTAVIAGVQLGDPRLCVTLQQLRRFVESESERKQLEEAIARTCSA